MPTLNVHVKTTPTNLEEEVETFPFSDEWENVPVVRVTVTADNKSADFLTPNVRSPFSTWMEETYDLQVVVKDHIRLHGRADTGYTDDMEAFLGIMGAIHHFVFAPAHRHPTVRDTTISA